MIRFGPEVCGNLEAALHREWLETNGLGGFASSTIIGLNTRRYHGLLIAATKPPVGRLVLLSKLEEALINNVENLEAYPDDPRGPSCLVLGHSGPGYIIHVVCGATPSGRLRLITVYLRTLSKWVDERTRKR